MADNIFERIPGDLVHDAMRTLPHPPTEQRVVIDAPRIGRVRIHFRWKELRVHRSMTYFWSAFRAEKEAAE